jgi:hypothetical protein
MSKNCAHAVDIGCTLAPRRSLEGWYACGLQPHPQDAPTYALETKCHAETGEIGMRSQSWDIYCGAHLAKYTASPQQGVSEEPFGLDTCYNDENIDLKNH